MWLNRNNDDENKFDKVLRKFVQKMWKLNNKMYFVYVEFCMKMLGILIGSKLVWDIFKLKFEGWCKIISSITS